MDKNTTGRFIAELRKQKGFTQKELAEKEIENKSYYWKKKKD